MTARRAARLGRWGASFASGKASALANREQPKPDMDLEARARSVPEVRDVRNLLHLRKVPAPGRADSPGKQRTKSP